MAVFRVAVPETKFYSEPIGKQAVAMILFQISQKEASTTRGCSVVYSGSGTTIKNYRRCL